MEIHGNVWKCPSMHQAWQKEYRHSLVPKTAPLSENSVDVGDRRFNPGMRDVLVQLWTHTTYSIWSMIIQLRGCPFFFEHCCATALGKLLLTRSEDLLKQCQTMLSSRGQSKRWISTSPGTARNYDPYAGSSERSAIKKTVVYVGLCLCILPYHFRLEFSLIESFNGWGFATFRTGIPSVISLRSLKTLALEVSLVIVGDDVDSHGKSFKSCHANETCWTELARFVIDTFCTLSHAFQIIIVNEVKSPCFTRYIFSHTQSIPPASVWFHRIEPER